LLRQIVPDFKAGRVEGESVKSLRNVVLVDNSAGRVETAGLGATVPFGELLQDSWGWREERIVPDSPLERDEIINIQFTSGTTSMPKAACLTHTGILNNGYFIGLRMGLTPASFTALVAS